MIRKEIQDLLLESLKELQKNKAIPVFGLPEIRLEKPEEISYGDYSSNIGMIVAKQAKINPKEAAGLVKTALEKRCPNMFEKIEIAGPGFINFFISKDYLAKEIEEITKKKKDYGKIGVGEGEKVNVEFISANPTGPLHVGNARGGFCGDVLANVLNKAGYKASKEYYINNMGRQIEVLKGTLEGKEGYKNEYTDYLISKKEKDPQKAVEYIRKEIEKTVTSMKIKYDRWFKESDLFDSREIEKVKEELKKKDLVEEKDGALWFKSAEFGDDKDRVLIRENGKATYLLSDIAYLKNKFKRGFKKIIIFLGAEHHGYIGRVKAGAEALGYPKEAIVPIIMQLVRLIEDGKEVKMSKRTGVYVTIDELLKEVGPDVARFFFLLRSYGSHLDFDLNIAKEQSSKNPVFYVQYAHARICSILRKAKTIKAKPRSLFNHPSESNLVKQLIRLPEIVEDTAKDYQVQRIPQYAMDLATSFHKFYQDCRVISEDKELTKSRMALALATKIVLKNALDLMGVSAPERM